MSINEFDPELVAAVIKQCKCSKDAAIDLLSWVDRHSVAYHGGQPENCEHCMEMIRIYGPMPDGGLVRAACSARDSYERRHSTTYQKQQIPSKLRLEILNRDDYACRQCGATTGLTVDHIFPERLGGTLDPGNLQILCQTCNSKKGMTTPTIILI